MTTTGARLLIPRVIVRAALVGPNTQKLHREAA